MMQRDISDLMKAIEIKINFLDLHIPLLNCFLIWNGTKYELEQFTENVVSLNSYLKFTKGVLDSLDSTISLAKIFILDDDLLNIKMHFLPRISGSRQIITEIVQRTNFNNAAFNSNKLQESFFSCIDYGLNYYPLISDVSSHFPQQFAKGIQSFAQDLHASINKLSNNPDSSISNKSKNAILVKESNVLKKSNANKTDSNEISSFMNKNQAVSDQRALIDIAFSGDYTNNWDSGEKGFLSYIEDKNHYVFIGSANEYPLMMTDVDIELAEFPIVLRGIYAIFLRNKDRNKTEVFKNFRDTSFDQFILNNTHLIEKPESYKKNAFIDRHLNDIQSYYSNFKFFTLVGMDYEEVFNELLNEYKEFLFGKSYDNETIVIVKRPKVKNMFTNFDGRPLDSIIQLVANGTLTNQWKNHRVGYFESEYLKNTYRFIETSADGKTLIIAPSEINDKTCPPIATGFVAYIVNRWSSIDEQSIQSYISSSMEDFQNINRLQISPQEDKDTYANFLQWLMDNERNAYNKSRCIFDFITDKDKIEIEKVYKEFCHYIQRTIETLMNNNVSKSSKSKISFNPKLENINRKKIIEIFDLLDTKNGWKSVFKNIEDRDNLAMHLVNFFMDNDDFSNPPDTIVCKRRSVTKLSKALRYIYDELSPSEVLRSDKGFFNALRILEMYHDLTDSEIYNKLTKDKLL